MIIISGPSTIGKNPLIELICDKFNYKFITPVTTRLIRAEEQDEIDYFFVDKETFKKKIKNSTIFEWDYCLSNYYGFYKINTNKKYITHALSRMAMRIKKRHPEVITVFLMPNELDSISNTLSEIYSNNELTLRLDLIEEEILHSTLFDYVFKVNNGRELISDPTFLNLIR